MPLSQAKSNVNKECDANCHTYVCMGKVMYVLGLHPRVGLLGTAGKPVPRPRVASHFPNAPAAKPSGFKRLDIVEG